MSLTEENLLHLANYQKDLVPVGLSVGESLQAVAGEVCQNYVAWSGLPLKSLRLPF